MKHRSWWITAMFVALSLLLVACGSGPSGEEKAPPSKLEPIEGSDYQRVVVTEKAAQRLDIQTVPLVEEQVVRKRAFGGEVVALPQADPGDPGPVWAHVSLSKGHANQVDGLGGSWKDQLNSVLAQHADKLTEATQVLSGQLEKIAELEGSIEKVLHVQQTVDGTLKDVSTSEEFKETLATLRSHLEASDKFLKELAKPRMITLVEEEGEISTGT